MSDPTMQGFQNVASTPQSTGLTRDDVISIIYEILGNSTQRIKINSGQVQSSNFVSGSSGWAIKGNGDVEFGNGTFRGTINATGGTISGDLTVTGSLLTDDGTGFQTKIISGSLGFLKSGSLKAFIKTATGSNGMQLSSIGSFYFTDLSGVPNAELDTNSNLKFSNNSYISWAGGRKLTADNSKISADGDLNITGSYGQSGNISNTGHISESNVNTFSIEIRNGIIMNFNKNS